MTYDVIMSGRHSTIDFALKCKPTICQTKLNSCDGLRLTHFRRRIGLVIRCLFSLGLITEKVPDAAYSLFNLRDADAWMDAVRRPASSEAPRQSKSSAPLGRERWGCLTTIEAYW